MSFPRYESYKDSGVEWLGEVPEHWNVRRLKQACEVFPSNVDKKSYENESPVLLCNYTDVYKNEKITPQIDFMAATASAEQVKKFTLQEGDTIITKDSETADDIAIAAYVPQNMPGVICGYHLSMVRPREVTCGAFVKRLFDSIYVKSCCAVYANGLTRVGLGQYALDNLEMPFPPVSEQQTIAAFLDRETAKIDALIAEQQRLIELLKEKRQAVISHAVTKGLNPNAPMKDSGIEWLGEVPEHWELKRLKRISDVLLSNVDKHTVEGQKAVRLCNYVDVYKNERITSEIDFMRATASDDQIKRLTVIKGDVIITKDSEDPSDIGVPALVVEDIPELICGYHLALIRSKTSIGGFLHYLFRGNFVRSVFQVEATGMTRYALGKYSIENLEFAAPPENEQQTIAAFLDNETAKLDTLTAEAKSAITLLQERRTALISAAVTGKIDVRGLVFSDKQ